MSDEVPDGWATGPVLNFFHLQRGHDLPVQDRNPGPVPIIASNGAVGLHDQSPLSGPGVITGRSETIGNVNYVEGAYWPLNTTLYVRDFKEADPKFVYYFLQNFPLKDYQSGTGVPTLNRNDVHVVDVVFPPPAEQRRIAEVLRSVDEAIAAADAVICGLESAALDIAERAFADPDAVELDYEIATFGDQFDIKGGNQPPKSSFLYQPKEGYVRLLQIRDFESDDKAAYISEKSSNVRCEADDVLIARYGASVGRILTGKAGAYNVALTKIVFRGNRITRRYAYHWLKSEYFQDRIRAVSNRSAQAGFNKEDLFPTKIALPPLSSQAAIAEALDASEKAVWANRVEREQMTELKTALLGDLLSGRVRVPA